MHKIQLGFQRSLSRRTFLRAAGAGIALPLLDAMMPAFAKESAKAKIPRRMVCIQTNMGIMPQFFFPEKSGRDYALTPYLEKLATHRHLEGFLRDMTIFQQNPKL